MFCPECGTLSFPDSRGHIRCTNPKCGYEGPIDPRMADVTSSLQADVRPQEVIDDSDQIRGVLTHGDHVCPKCDQTDVFAELRQTRASDEPETRLLTCRNCGHGWREY